MFKSSKRAVSKKKNVIVSLLLVAALAITGALAYLTATDSAENKFTVGNVDISLTEPNWNESNGENIVAGQVITKDPTVTNTGANNAYVYMMVQVPKADSISVYDETNGTITVDDHQLFSYNINEGWTLVDSKIDENDANNYYLYAYDTALAPNGVAALFNEVTFVNTTSDFEATNLSVEITGYAIQSDYYNNEATGAASAWKLYVNQNGWKFPANEAMVQTPDGQSTLNFVDEDDNIVHSVTAEEGPPVTMYFEPTLAKTGYTFDWVDESTGEVAYSGMPMPEENTTLSANYTLINQEVTQNLEYTIHYDSKNGIYAALHYGALQSSLYSQLNDTSIVIPAYIHVTLGKEDSFGQKAYSSDANLYLTEDVTSWDIYEEYKNVEIEIPVKKLNSQSLKFLDPSSVFIPDSVVMLDTHVASDGITGLANCQQIVLPYGITEIPDNFASSSSSLTSISIPNSVISIGKQALRDCTNLTSVTLPNSVTTIGESAFSSCTALVDIFIPDSVVDIGAMAFSSCSNLTTASVPSTCTVGDDAFPSTCTVTYR